MKKVLKTLLFILGAPAILAVIVVSSLVIYERGISYGIWPFVGTILAGVFCLVFIITFVITGRSAKKRANKKSIFKGTVALLVVAFIFTAGLWLVIDIPLPGILDDATSGTVKFDKVQEDYVYKANEHGDLLDNFIKMNYDIENLKWVEGEYSEAEKEAYVAEGYRNEQVRELIHKNFTSIDSNGYVTFTSNGPWISFADGGRMTIPTLVHLVINKREVANGEPVEPKEFYLIYHVTPNVLVTKKTPSKFATKEARTDENAPVTWSVLDMQGGAMDIGLGDILVDALGGEDAANMMLDIVVTAISEQVVPILTNLNSALATEDVVGAPLYVTVDLSDAASAKLSLASSTTTRGMHGYMHSAWLNSNNLLFAVISLFPARQWLYILGSWLMFTAVAVGALRYSEYAKDKDGEEGDAQMMQGPYGRRPVAQSAHPYAPRPQMGPNPHAGYYRQEFNPRATPYQRAQMSATRDRNRRLY